MTIFAIASIIGSPVLAGFGWVTTKGIQAITRITVLETQHDDLLTLINTRFDAVDGRLSRIERSMNGKLKE